MYKGDGQFPTLNWRIHLVLFLILFGSSIGSFIYGWTLRSGGQNFSQYWVLALLLLWGSMISVQKSLNRKKDSDESN